MRIASKARTLSIVSIVGALAMTLLGGQSITAQTSTEPVGTEDSFPAIANDSETDSLAARAITDAEGRHQYIIALKSDEAKNFPKSFIPSETFPAHNKGEVVNFVQSFAADYAITVNFMNSWGVVMFAAFLTDDQVYSIRADARVAGVEQDQIVKFSDDTTAVWSDSAVTLAAPPNAIWNKLVTQTSEVQGWGKRAVNQSTTSSNGTTLVYVLDQGPSQHVDLNVVEWTNYLNSYDCGSRVTANQTCSSDALKTLIGCSSHATVVAGIIGAKANGTGIVGIDPNVALVSVSSLTPSPNATLGCNAGTSSAGTVIAALGWIMSDITNRPGSRLRVVNISQNTPMTTLYTQMHAAATPTSSYPGALIVQSAGNDFADACSHAYNTTSASDGILVVGAINNHGQPVVPLSGSPGFWKDAADSNGASFGHEAGSNFGSCVETWAPGDAIYSTFGTAVASQNSGTQSNKYGYGSGTSFAAPHVVGLAAYLLESVLAITPANLEQTIRAHYSNLGSRAPQYSAFPPNANNFHVNAGGLPINLPTLNPVQAPNPKSTTYAELIMSVSCSYPKWVTSSPGAGCLPVNYQNSLISQQGLPFFNGSVEAGWAPNRFTLSETTGHPIYIMFDSYGAGNWTCDVSQGTGFAGSTVINSGGQYYYDFQIVVPGTLVFSSACPSASINNNHS